MRRECVEVSSRSAASSSVARWRRLAKSACGRKGRGALLDAGRASEGVRRRAGAKRDWVVGGKRVGGETEAGASTPAAGALLAGRRSLSGPPCAAEGGSSAAGRPPRRAGQQPAPAAATRGCGTRAGRARGSRPARGRPPPPCRSSAARRVRRAAAVARYRRAPARPACVLVRAVAV